jgi:hypothetical protein
MSTSEQQHNAALDQALQRGRFEGQVITSLDEIKIEVKHRFTQLETESVQQGKALERVTTEVRIQRAALSVIYVAVVGTLVGKLLGLI